MAEEKDMSEAPVTLRALTLDQLDDKLLELKKEQFNLRFQRASGQLENTSRVRKVRRAIARVITITKQKRDGEKQPANAETATQDTAAAE